MLDHYSCDNEVHSENLVIGNVPYNYNTLEPKVLKINGLTNLNSIFGTNYLTEDEMRKYMRNNKTDCALKLFETSENIAIPQYILEAIEW